MQGDAAPGNAPGARAGHKRRPAATTPAAAELPPGGLILPVGQVPVLSFGGKNVIDPADCKAVDAAVHRLGGKTIANALVLLVEQEVAAAREQAAHGQPTATAAVSTCDGGRTGYGGGGSAKKSKRGKPKTVIGLALDKAVASKADAQIARLGGSTEAA